MKRVGVKALFIKGLRWGLRLAFLGALLFCLAWAVFPFSRERLASPPAAVRLLDIQGGTLRVLLGPGDSLRHPLEGTVSDQWLAQALVAAEDKRFFEHPGVDPAALLRAVKQNITSRRVVSGASTLSTQLMRMTRPRQRTLPVKAAEAFRALQMERQVGKEEILRHYLDRAPFGGNLVGAEAASRTYFGKAPGDLTLGEASLLAGLPQSPSRFRPDRHLERALERRRYVLDRMEALGMIEPGQRRAAERQSLHPRRAAMPFRAPHFCEWVMSARPEAVAAAARQGGRLATTLDPGLQALAERCVREAAPALAKSDIHALAAVVLDVHNSAVRAMVGSVDYFDAEASGQVNHALRARSAGSTLKPFLFGLAMDRGLCLPETRLSDAPLYYPDYEPGNFDLQFRGAVTSRQALADSLNIPALRLAQRCGLERFHLLLQDLGLQTINRPPAHYGLSLALGTAEVRLLDLANAYACLARGGVYRPVSPLVDPAWMPTRRRLLSEEACWLLADILGSPERQAGLYGVAGGPSQPRAAWKTGTSNGYRDAWTVAYDRDFVVAVWAGNSDGHAAPALIGAEVAAPLAGRIFSAVHQGRPGPWFERPEGLVERTLCAQSGLLHGASCRHGVSAWLIRGQAGPRPCSACTGDEHPAETRAGARIPPLRILFPTDGDCFRRIGETHAVRQEIGLRSSSPGATHWYVNGQYLGRSDTGRTLPWSLAQGRHVLACCDQHGRTASIAFQVE